ncbi:hypothetical protein LRAMOSA04817 [Lichtheimia ramosa]|uniref:PHD-type domain-containing protein n=1 Tax=Lichtheimia ramosa TaxID=688394 RepID=A0A077WYE3_9FUNG|nr:hypothetical protein LRAMOSA04817 [Lichtheimia ramosa]
MKGSSQHHFTDSDISLQLSDASPLSSESDQEQPPDRRRLSDTTVANKPASKQTSKKKKAASNAKKKTTNKKRSSNATTSSVNTITIPVASLSSPENKQYCICRKGYDGKEFMIACDGCQEWFHGRCVGVKPKSVTGKYFCEACSTTTTKSRNKGRKGKSKRKTNKNQPVVVEPVTISLSRDEEDIDDICPVCDTECTCGAAEPEPTTEPTSVPAEPTSIETHKETELVATDDWEVTDDKMVVERIGIEPDQELLDVDAISDMDDAKSSTYTSSIHIDSGDDEDLEREEEAAIIRDVLQHGDASDFDSDDLLEEEEEEDEEAFYYYADETDDSDTGIINEESDNEYEHASFRMYSLGEGWTSSEEEEEDIDHDHEEEIVDSHAAPADDVSGVDGNLFDSIASAFMEILTPLAENQDMASLLGLVTTDQQQPQQDMGRRLSLPSSAVQDHPPEELTSETLGAMAALESELPLSTAKEDEHPFIDHQPEETVSLPTTPIQYDLKLQEQLFELVGNQSAPSSPREILSNPADSPDINEKKRSFTEPHSKNKKRRISISSSATPPPDENEAVPMDELVDTSQLYTRSSSSPEPEEPDTQVSRDLSRWQRVPIGAFRLMRSKNKLWLER